MEIRGAVIASHMFGRYQILEGDSEVFYFNIMIKTIYTYGFSP